MATATFYSSLTRKTQCQIPWVTMKLQQQSELERSCGKHCQKSDNKILLLWIN